MTDFEKKWNVFLYDTPPDVLSVGKKEYPHELIVSAKIGGDNVVIVCEEPYYHPDFIKEFREVGIAHFNNTIETPEDYDRALKDLKNMADSAVEAYINYYYMSPSTTEIKRLTAASRIIAGLMDADKL